MARYITVYSVGTAVTKGIKHIGPSLSADMMNKLGRVKNPQRRPREGITPPAL